MGKGYTIECKKCGYCKEFHLGVGFSYPYVYRATMREARRGQFGIELKKLLWTHSKAAIDPTLVLTRCPQCHTLSREVDLTAYLPNPGYHRKRGKKQIWSSEMPCLDVDYVSPSDMTENYSACCKYDHRCGKCNSEAEVIKENEMMEKVFYCPECGSVLSVSQNIHWD